MSGADAPPLRFTDRSADAQRTYEKRFQSGLSARVIRRTSSHLSQHPRVTGTAGARRAFRYSVKRRRSYGRELRELYTAGPRPY